MSFAFSLRLLALLTGCAVSREQQLARKADRIETKLVNAQTQALELPVDSTQRAKQLEHLEQLRTWLSAANISRGQIQHFTSIASIRTLAYDILEEAYDTIEWNIPLLPSDPIRRMPSGLSADGSLQLGTGQFIAAPHKNQSSGYIPPTITPAH